MSYFSYFKEVAYNFFPEGKIEDFKQVTDITLRFKLNEFLRKTKLVNLTYHRVHEGDRPDIVSYKLYERPDLHWLIFIYNEMVNPLFEWPMSSIEVRKNTDEKYKGSSLFLNVHGVESPFESDASRSCRGGKDNFPIEDYEIRSGDRIRLKVKNSSVEYPGEILSCNYDMGEIRVHFPTNNFPPDEERISLNNYDIFLDTTLFPSRQDGSVALNDYCFALVKQSAYSVHHFEKDGRRLSPLESYQRALNDKYDEPWSSEVVDASGQKPNVLSVQKGEASYLSNICFKDTLLGKYLLESNTNYVVTNDFHEFQENENNRQILVPSPAVIPDILRSLERILR